MTDLRNSESEKNSAEFLLNVVPLKVQWNKNWQIYEIEVEDWNKKEGYNLIREFKLSFSLEDVLIESHGRLLVLLPLKDHISEDDLNASKTALTQKLGKGVNLIPINDPLKQAFEDDIVLEAIRKGFGEIITYELNKLGFKKIGSGGGIGEFLPPENWLNKTHEVNLDNSKIFRAFRLSIIPRTEEKQFYLAADLKGKYKEQQNLLDLLKLGIKREKSFKALTDIGKSWQISLSPENEKLFPNSIEQETFEIQSIESWNDIQENPLGWGRYAKDSLKNLVKQKVISEPMKSEPFLVVKPSGRMIKNPNIYLTLPARFFYRHLSQPRIKNEKHDREFKKFTRISVQKRYNLISAFFELLKEKALIGSKISFEGHPIGFSRPSVKKHIVREYGKPPKLNEWGVESWGLLKKIDVFYEKKISYKVEKFYEILEKYIQDLLSRSKMDQPQVEVNLHPIKDGKIPFNRILGELDQTCCPIFFRGSNFGNYRKIKTKFTQEKGIPVQVIREKTLFESRNLYALVRTVFPQMIAKSGGLPYRLAPPLLDRAILIGLDKARDSSGRRPSASAGVAAVTPEGRYVSGASTPLENNFTDFIDVDKLAPDLLRELEEKKFEKSYEYAVILRDGSPKTCMHEVPQWRKHLQEYQKDFIFIASRKSHEFRVFPKEISDSSSQKGIVKYKIPLVLSGAPLQPSDFLVIAAKAPRGTPQPVLYTIMENTTPLSNKEIKEKVIAQIISMSMLCWESPLPTSQPLPLHYADKLAEFTQLVQMAWNSSNRFPMFI